VGVASGFLARGANPDEAYHLPRHPGGEMMPAATRKFLPTLSLAMLVAGFGVLVPAAGDEGTPITGTGLCAKCSLHMTAVCQNAVVVTADGLREVYFLSDNDVSKAFHRVVCKTSVPVSIVGRVVKRSGTGAVGKVVVGEIEPSRIAEDDCPIPEEVTIAGVGQCAKCSLNKSTTCRNVLVCHLDGKDPEFWLADNGVSKAFHKTICKTKEPVLVTGRIVGHPPADGVGHAEFAALAVELVVLAAPPDDDEMTMLRGYALCARYTLGTTATCRTAIRHRLDGKFVYEFLTENDVDKAFHKAICRTAPKAVDVTGFVVMEPYANKGGAL